MYREPSAIIKSISNPAIAIAATSFSFSLKKEKTCQPAGRYSEKPGA